MGTIYASNLGWSMAKNMLRVWLVLGNVSAQMLVPYGPAMVQRDGNPHDRKCGTYVNMENMFSNMHASNDVFTPIASLHKI